MLTGFTQITPTVFICNSCGEETKVGEVNPLTHNCKKIDMGEGIESEQEMNDWEATTDQQNF